MPHMNACITPDKDTLLLSEEIIDRYLSWEREKGLSERMLRQIKGQLRAFYGWLPEDKQVDRTVLKLWRQDMGARNYSAGTISSYVKSINRFLAYAGHSELRFTQGLSHDLTGMRFGCLTAVEATGERNRKDIVWLCRCSCGNECKVPATRLVSGNTFSCGCLKGEHLKAVNKFIDNTSLRMSLEEKPLSQRSGSGYTGVVAKRGKWCAQIKYKGRNYHLGSFDELDKAIAARAAAKQLVQEDAMNLLEVYEALHAGEELPARHPTRIEKASPAKADPEAAALRTDNKSGVTGVFMRRGKWTAKISYQKKTYILGSFTDMDEAVSARKRAERLLKEEPSAFLAEYGSFPTYINKLPDKENRHA